MLGGHPDSPEQIDNNELNKVAGAYGISSCTVAAGHQLGYGNSCDAGNDSKQALQYSPVMAVVLVVLRTFLGFCFLAELACLVRLLTGKIQNGVLSVAVLIAFEKFMYYSLGGGILQYCKADADVSQAKMEIDLIKTTIVPFFTFRSMTDDFTEWLRYGIVAGFVLAAVTAFAIVWYYMKGDIGDADRDA